MLRNKAKQLDTNIRETKKTLKKFGTITFI